MQESEFLVMNNQGVLLDASQIPSATGSEVTIYKGATLVSAATSMHDIKLTAGQTMHVSEGGSVENIEIVGAGIMNVSNGGVATGVSYSDEGAAVNVLSGGQLLDAENMVGVTVSRGGIVSGGTFNTISVKGGGSASDITVGGVGASLIPASDAVLKNITISRGGLLKAGAVAENVTVSGGGAIENFLTQVGTAAFIEKISNNAIVGSASGICSIDGELKVGDGGFVTDSVFTGALGANGGFLVLSAGASAADVNFESTGRFTVSSGAVLSGTVEIAKDAGKCTLGKGATLRGILDTDSSYTALVLTVGCNINFDLSFYSGEAMINNMENLGADNRKLNPKMFAKQNYNEAPNYFITIPASIKDGEYVLASGLSKDRGFTKTVTVLGEKDTVLGTITVAECLDDKETKSKTVGDYKLTLAYTKTNTLTLTVAHAGEPETKSLTVTTLDDVVNAYDGKISLREAVLYASQGTKSTVVGHVGEAYIDFDRLTGDIALDTSNGTIIADTQNLVIESTSGINVITSDFSAFKFKQEATLKNVKVSTETLTVLPADVSVSVLVGKDVSASSSSDMETTINLGAGASNATVFGGPLVTKKTLDTAGNFVQTAGTITLNIQGGTFNDLIFAGGGALTWNTTECVTVANTSLNIDASANKITINPTARNGMNFGGLYAGGAGFARVSGTSTMTFTGDGSNLTFGTNVYISGDSNNALTGGEWSGDASVHNGRYVQGNRTLAFNGFTGNFGATKIAYFDCVSFNESNDVNFTSSKIDFSDVKEWSFNESFGINWANGVQNDFTNDSFEVDFASASGSKTLIQAASSDAFEGFDAMEEVKLAGLVATWSSEINGYATVLYSLTVTEDNKLVVSTIA